VNATGKRVAWRFLALVAAVPANVCGSVRNLYGAFRWSDKPFFALALVERARAAYHAEQTTAGRLHHTGKKPG